ncbi:hypothetical protein Rhe02_85890 [Rhizocola hellebori]|uniref:Uncharacterized protein n=1 Tax=Rhizocola hellebori TaxID=1392758 RepID=A0A8J3QJ01_9ACTN|nr:hypothetical protein [Rhizocola hellebori]GIH10522.1 hypothetical protein Rhe02_85890 [Rhizocola hellebori]
MTSISAMAVSARSGGPVRPLLVAGLSLVLLSGCVVARSGESSGGPVEIPAAASTPSGNVAGGQTVASYFWPPKQYPGPTWTKDGRKVDKQELNSSGGPEHCGWQSAVVLHLGWPLGTVSETMDQARQYIRDPGGAIDKDLRDKLMFHVAMPADARDTGYRYNAVELWLSPSNPDAAYLRVGDDIELWPRPLTVVACK